MKKHELEGLQSFIAARVARSLEFNAEIAQVHGDDRRDLRAEKKAHGAVTRDHLLVYAYLRGVPYRVVEPTAAAAVGESLRAAHRRWWAEQLLKLARNVASHAPAELLSKDAIVAWLATPESAERAAVRAAARTAWFAARDAARARAAAARSAA